MYNSHCLIIYPFSTSHFNSSWWCYPCILPLIFNIARSFRFFLDVKKTTSPCFTMRFAKAIPWDTNDMQKKLLACQILRRKFNWTFSSTQMFLFLQRHWDNPQRVFKQERSSVRHLSVRYIYSLVASLITTFTFHWTLYLIHNEWSRRLEKIKGSIECFFCYLGFDAIYSVSSILSSTFYLHPILVLCFLLAFYKN